MSAEKNRKTVSSESGSAMKEGISKPKSPYDNVASKLLQPTRANATRDKVIIDGASRERLWNSNRIALQRQSIEEETFRRRSSNGNQQKSHGKGDASPLDVRHSRNGQMKNSFQNVQSKLFTATKAAVVQQREKVLEIGDKREKGWKPCNLNNIATKPDKLSKLSKDKWSSVSSRLLEPTTATTRGRWNKETMHSPEILHPPRSSSVPRDLESRRSREIIATPHSFRRLSRDDSGGQLQTHSSVQAQGTLPSYKDRLDLYIQKKQEEAALRKESEKNAKQTFRVSKGSAPTTQQLVGSYIMYRKLVGESDGGTLLTEEQFTALKAKAQRAKQNKIHCLWKNLSSGAECYEIGPDSRCFCGHMYKSHAWYNIDDKNVHCRVPDCRCPLYAYVNGNGAWFIRCTCKHAYQDHMDRGLPVDCQQEGCSCQAFYSAFCCSCGDGWAGHGTVFENESERRNRYTSASVLLPASKNASQSYSNAHPYYTSTAASHQDGTIATHSLEDSTALMSDLLLDCSVASDHAGVSALESEVEGAKDDHGDMYPQPTVVISQTFSFDELAAEVQGDFTVVEQEGDQQQRDFPPAIRDEYVSTNHEHNQAGPYGTQDETYKNNAEYLTYDGGQSALDQFAFDAGTEYQTYHAGQATDGQPAYDASTEYQTYHAGQATDGQPTYDAGTEYQTYHAGQATDGQPAYDASTEYQTYHAGQATDGQPTYDASTEYQTYHAGQATDGQPTYDAGTEYQTYHAGQATDGQLTYDASTEYQTYHAGQATDGEIIQRTETEYAITHSELSTHMSNGGANDVCAVASKTIEDMFVKNAARSTAAIDAHTEEFDRSQPELWRPNTV